MKKIFLTATVFLFLASISPAADSHPEIGPVDARNNGLSTELAEEIESLIIEKMAELHSPGIAIGIVQGDRLVYEGYFGWANIEDEEPVKDTTIFRIGSISKTFTAMGLMQQWEQGKFKLDDEFNSYMPYEVVRPKQETCGPVTFKHMITHTSGGGELMSYRQLTNLDLTMYTPKGEERHPLREIYVDGIRPGVCAEDKWCYCNFCYGALGFALEEISGESFQDYTQNHVLGPIGMSSSSFYENDEIMANIAQGYAYKKAKDDYKPTRFWSIPVPPMGNMFSTVQDMGKYMVALVNNGANSEGKLVEPETLAFMYQTHYQLNERHSGMGITFMMHPDLWGHRVYGHGGAVPGFGSSMYFVPDKKIGLIVFANVMSSPPGAIAAGTLKLLLGGETQTDFPAPDKEVWPLLVGYYGSQTPEFLSDFRFNMSALGAYQVMVRKDELVLTTLRHDKFYPLRQVNEDDPHFYFIEREGKQMPSYITFVFGKEEAAVSVFAGMNEYVRLTGADLARARMRAMRLAMMPKVF